MKQKELLEQILPYIGGAANAGRSQIKNGTFYLTVKDRCLVDLESLRTLDGIMAAELARTCLKVTAQGLEKEEEMKVSKKNYDELAGKIIDLVGGKENIELLTHCITRLRLNVKDKDKVALDTIKQSLNVLGAQWSGDQLQIIVGNEVADVYEAVRKKLGFQATEAVNEKLDDLPTKEKFSITKLFDILSACVVPIIPAMCGTGVIKGILILLTTYNLISAETGIYILLNAVSDATFYFLPMLIAASAAKKFNVNTTLSLILAGLYLHPSIIGFAGNDLNVLGINIHILNYSSTLLPILISVWVMGYIYRFIDKYMPKVLRVVFSPALTLLVMAPLCIGVIGPLGYYIGTFLGQGIYALYNVNGFIAGFINGALRPLIILTGMQTVFTPIMLNNLATLGYDFIMPVHTVATMAAAGMCLGAFLRAKKSNNKENYFSAFVSAFIGITEPALYGIAFRFKSLLIALMLGGGISGAFVAGMKAKCYSAGMPSWISLPIFGDTIPMVVIGLVIAFVSTTVLSYMFGFGSKEE